MVMKGEDDETYEKKAISPSHQLHSISPSYLNLLTHSLTSSLTKMGNNVHAKQRKTENHLHLMHLFCQEFVIGRALLP